MLTSSQKSHVSRARQASHVVGSQSGRVAGLCGVLFLSGTGALIFETLWLRLSGLAFGNSIWAAALILSSFMAGLALGNAIAASSRIRRWRPLHLYALLEVLVALFRCPNRFWSSGAGRIVATSVASSVELSARASWTAIRCVFPNSTCADNGDGSDAAGVDRRSDVAANQFWESDWFSVRLEHFGRGGRCCAR